jgi:hypothetical protein
MSAKALLHLVPTGLNPMRTKSANVIACLSATLLCLALRPYVAAEAPAVPPIVRGVLDRPPPEKRDGPMTSSSLHATVTHPPKALLNKVTEFQVKLANQGSRTLNNVLVSATCSDGLEPWNPAEKFELDVGRLPARETRTISIRLIARQPGVQTLTVVVSSGNRGCLIEATVEAVRPTAANSR